MKWKHVFYRGVYIYMGILYMDFWGQAFLTSHGPLPGASIHEIDASFCRSITNDPWHNIRHRFRLKIQSICNIPK